MFQIYKVSLRHFASHSYRNDIIIGAHVFLEADARREWKGEDGWGMRGTRKRYSTHAWTGDFDKDGWSFVPKDAEKDRPEEFAKLNSVSLDWMVGFVFFQSTIGYPCPPPPGEGEHSLHI